MMKKEKLYDDLYYAQKDNILWGKQPGRLVQKIKEYITSGNVLDIGCGDGKNALYLEQLDFKVTGYDYSIPALEGLKNRFKNAGRQPKGVYEFRNLERDIPTGLYDILISYGVFHCLEPKDRIILHKKIMNLVRPKGFMFFTCLTDILPLPVGHGTSHVYLVGLKEIEELLEGWKILYKEEGIIIENHLPIIGEHSHSAQWIIAQKL
jgi:tellurite methyltransferase